MGGLVQRRPRCHQYDHRRGTGHHQSSTCITPSRRHFRDPRQRPPVLQELELPSSGDVTVNDAFKPVSRYFDRVWRPEQLPSALLAGMRVLTDPVETGAVTIAIPQDVQAEAFDWPESFFAERVWHVARPLPRTIGDRTRRRDHPLGSQATDRRRRRRDLQPGQRLSISVLCANRNPPWGRARRGKGSLVYDHPQSVGGAVGGSTGTTAANALATEADVVIGIGTRYSDFTSASRTAFTNPDVRFVNINVASLDSVKQGGVSVVADAREALDALALALNDYRVDDEYASRIGDLARDWDAIVESVYNPAEPAADGSLNQNQVIGLVNTLSDPRDVVVCAAGSMPGDLHKLWRTRDSKGYHVEYGYSCMGYEVAGGLGVRMACPDRDVFVMVGDGSYLMMATELVTAVQERLKVIVVLVQNHGFASIGSLSESLGSQRFGTQYRYRSNDGRLDGGGSPGRSGRERCQPRCRRHPRQHRCRVRRRDQGCQSKRHQHRHPRRNRSADRRPPGQRILVGCTGIGHLRTGVHQEGTDNLRVLEEDPATVPPSIRMKIPHNHTPP